VSGATPRTPDEGPLHLVGATAAAAADESIGPSIRKSAGRRMTSVAIAHFGMISTVYYQDSPFIRFILYV